MDIPRTSSTSLKYELARQFGAAFGKMNVNEPDFATKQQFPDHMRATEVRAMIGADIWNDLFTFTIVRNPWDRMHSLYFYRKKVEEIPADWTFREYVLRFAAANEFTPYFRYPPLRIAAADFIFDETGEAIVSTIIPFEDRHARIADIAQKIGIADLGTTHIQAATPDAASYLEAYDDETRQAVSLVWQRDITLFGYEFEKPGHWHFKESVNL
ncbi:sulfotransferase family 2 domain-containing protein [Marivita geojedonensis]|uniref:sulfotransferase family 2 domain-containing protein n=1 Tax=Marivita geojedonensis TaxID=1123756 RepID=UPI000D464D63|nr:sulfotransferase family 2 domain-containing protein [Marivita geojedonensis]PRY74212.1 sulfotransferase family protein [Marivita geojedonensis]